MKTRKFVAYYRVSTPKQGISGLGLEAQRKAVLGYLDGGRWRLVAEETEVESGKRTNRPALAKALRLCRIHNATLIIAKLDRLARNVAFISNLMESGVEFTAVDFPQANRLTVHILAAVAEHEATLISARTKAALEAARARGTVLGNPNRDSARHARKGTQASNPRPTSRGEQTSSRPRAGNRRHPPPRDHLKFGDRSGSQPARLSRSTWRCLAGNSSHPPSKGA